MILTTKAIVQPELKELIIPLQAYWGRVITRKIDGVEVHHLIGHGVSAMGTKTHDLFTIPLCHEEYMNLHLVGATVGKTAFIAD
ncbi:MAG: hypothetical protein CENE_02642 [Candidatus Celerinatantimonas neptuna]|nr:MAG: hypothetical protein CENE_02642 [Candidatus Celerinatantimonas neptuna]